MWQCSYSRLFFLGDEVVDVCCCSSHVCAFTSDQEVFVWGGKNNRNTPQKLSGLNEGKDEVEDNKIVGVRVEEGVVAVTDRKGQLFTATFSIDNDDWGLLQRRSVDVKAKKVVILQSGLLILDGQDERVKFIDDKAEENKLVKVKVMPDDRKVRLLGGRGGKNAVTVDMADNVFKFDLKSMTFIPVDLSKKESLINGFKLIDLDLYHDFLTILYECST